MAVHPCGCSFRAGEVNCNRVRLACDDSLHSESMLTTRRFVVDLDIFELFKTDNVPSLMQPTPEQRHAGTSPPVQTWLPGCNIDPTTQSTIHYKDMTGSMQLSVQPAEPTPYMQQHVETSPEDTSACVDKLMTQMQLPHVSTIQLQSQLIQQLQMVHGYNLQTNVSGMSVQEVQQTTNTCQPWRT